MKKYLPVFMAAALTGLAAAQPAQAKVIEQGEDSFVTRDKVVVKATPFETWVALLAPGKWWNDSHSWSGESDNMYISAQAGGCFCELLPMPEGAPEGVRRGSALHMTVLQANPPQVLRMRGGLGPLQGEPVDGVLTITISPGDAGTTVMFEYVVGGYMRFKAADIAKAVDGVMSQQLHGLGKLLGPIAPAPVDEAEDESDATPESVPESGPKSGPDSGANDKAPADDDTVAPVKKAQSVDEAFEALADKDPA